MLTLVRGSSGSTAEVERGVVIFPKKINHDLR